MASSDGFYQFPALLLTEHEASKWVLALYLQLTARVYDCPEHVLNRSVFTQQSSLKGSFYDFLSKIQIQKRHQRNS